ncbi:MAG: ribosome silencing factor [Candidatus Auribacterota bacterium]|nr:ribosome silencing factor [Candidatus Auribacterota bacterium]
MNTDKLIDIAVGVAREKKGDNIVKLDMRGLSSIADFFLFCSGDNARQVKAIVEAISVELKKRGRRAKRIEGLPESRWVIMDYGDILIHVFIKEAREFYSLETLWGDAPQFIFPEEK